MLPKHAGFQATPHTETDSAQRESNPHFRHGKAAGYRYIMGAESLVELSKNRAPGGTRTHVAALRVRNPGRWTTRAFHSVGSEGLEPSPTWLRARHAATSTLIPFVLLAATLGLGAEGIEPSTWSL